MYQNFCAGLESVKHTNWRANLRERPTRSFEDATPGGITDLICAKLARTRRTGSGDGLVRHDVPSGPFGAMLGACWEQRGGWYRERYIDMRDEHRIAGAVFMTRVRYFFFFFLFFFFLLGNRAGHVELFSFVGDSASTVLQMMGEVGRPQKA